MAAAQSSNIHRERLLKHLAIFLGLMLLWEVAARMEWIDTLMFPRPSGILVSFGRIYFIQGNVWWHLWITMAEVVLGFLLGSALGIVLGGLVGFNALVRRFLKPYVIVMEATPRIAVAPLLIAALGFGWNSKLAIIMLVCFFAPFINTLSGVMNVNDDKLELFRSLRASKLRIFRSLVLPDAMPVIMAGLRLAMASALSGALVAEFIAANEGMGVLISRYTGSLNMASAFACILTLTAVGFIIFRGMELLDSHIVFWKHEPRMADMTRRRAAAWTAKFGEPKFMKEAGA